MEDLHQQWKDLQDRFLKGTKINEFKILLGDLEVYEQTLQVVSNDIDDFKPLMMLIPEFTLKLKEKINQLKEQGLSDTLEDINYGRELFKNLNLSSIRFQDKASLDKIKSLLDFYNKQLNLLNNVLKNPEDYPSFSNYNLMDIIDQVYAEKLFLEECVSLDLSRLILPAEDQTIKSSADNQTIKSSANNQTIKSSTDNQTNLYKPFKFKTNTSSSRDHINILSSDDQTNLLQNNTNTIIDRFDELFKNRSISNSDNTENELTSVNDYIDKMSPINLTSQTTIHDDKDNEMKQFIDLFKNKVDDIKLYFNNFTFH